MEKNDSESTPNVGQGYAAFQIAKALITSEQHEDPATRERAQQRLSRWTKVLDGILNDRIDVGSRTPIKDVPAWATLEVVTGGFATGDLLAGGPLLEHERERLAQLPLVTDLHARRVLNGSYLTDEGLAELLDRLRSGRFDVQIPEEGALLVVAWLVSNGHAEEARVLLDDLGPFLKELRFYPNLVDRPRSFGSQVVLRDVGTVIEGLDKIPPNLHILAQKEAIEIWAPLYDRSVGLFLETVEGDTPRLRPATDPSIIPTQQRFPVQGGWPCQVYPDGWHVRARKMLDDYDRERKEHRYNGKPDRAKEDFPKLREFLTRCIKDPRSLSGRDVGQIRLILASYVTKRDTPDSSYCLEVRKEQAQQSSAAPFHEISKVVRARLENQPKDGGIDDLNVIVYSITEEEGERWKIESGTSIPLSLQNKIQRCVSETIGALVENGVVTSGETLATVLPQMTSGIRAAGITDPSLRQLYGAIYRSFRRRRSLLLLNLESQIKIEELPWIAAIDRFRSDDFSTHELARQTLEEIASLTIVSFPHMILPNKLVQELRGLAKGAGLELPFVDEIATDIFRGNFSAQFERAASKAADLLEGTLYETYYGIDYHNVREITAVKRKSRFRKVVSRDKFANLCFSMAGVTSRGWDTANNGMVIEQQQVLTSQNLAVLFDEFDLKNSLGDRLEELAQRCFAWICQRQQVKADGYHARLIMLKNTAYAWRQMVFFLALLPATRTQAFIVWAEEYLSGQGVEFQMRFRPALMGLEFAADGRSLDDRSVIRQGVRRFLGWTNTEHWLLR